MRWFPAGAEAGLSPPWQHTVRCGSALPDIVFVIAGTPFPLPSQFYVLQVSPGPQHAVPMGCPPLTTSPSPADGGWLLREWLRSLRPSHGC